MDETLRTAEQQHLDLVYPQEEFEKDLMHYEVVSGYQTELRQKFGQAVDYLEAEWVACSLLETKAEKLETLRKKYSTL